MTEAGMRKATAASQPLLAFVLIIVVSLAQAGRLLVVPVDGSHWTGVKAVAEELGRRGHSVVVVIPEASLRLGPSKHCTTKVFPVSFTKSTIEAMHSTHMEMFRGNQTFLQWVSVYLKTMSNVIQLMTTTVENLLHNEELISYLRDQNFDALLTDPLMPIGVILAEYLGLPSVYMLRGFPCELYPSVTGCPSPPSFVPRLLTHSTDRMSFGQRLGNTLLSMLEPLLCKAYFWSFDGLASRILQRDVTVVDMMRGASLRLIRYDFTFEFPRPLMPNMVLVGGINCAVRSALPKDLETFVNGSGEHGFVVFTLGSMVSQMPEDKAQCFFEAFRQIPQRVLWRYTGPVPTNVPENVKLMKWLPQNDLLGHPKARAFVTHAGTHGIYEGICNAVPMVMLPLFGDQSDNVQRMVVRGVGEMLNIYDITVEQIVTTLNKVINDSSYKDKIMKLSAVHKDRPVEPLDLAVFWTEFVMRHKGADHLRPAAHDLNWIQYHSLDVISLLVVIIVTVVIVIVKSCRFCIRMCFRGKSQKRKKE
ncbi:UDP-glucuronosyltransferase 1A1-like isoform X2 [Paramormyrops kingsleyae]|uniref:UDP-glucuronosyltransferase 1A1-like isoform X2 n=1 Tax=Paramormyrops kingsleyae TaxID=1676925 RepID=UPI003B970E61